VAASVAVHVLLGLLLFRTASSVASPPPPTTYRVELVSVAAEEAPRREEPEPAEQAEEEHRPPPPEPTPEPKPETAPPQEEREEEVKRPSKEPARAAEEGEEAVNVQLEGANFPYPAYLRNIIRQINRYWRRPTGGRQLRAEISFVIHDDGSVSEIEWIRRSGDLAFDLEARGAVEAAGRAGAFGELPEGYPRDQLRVSFFFDPSVR
jgi:outer membrane biosynthesis protein TonB